MKTYAVGKCKESGFLWEKVCRFSAPDDEAAMAIYKAKCGFRASGKRYSCGYSFELCRRSGRKWVLVMEDLMPRNHDYLVQRRRREKRTYTVIGIKGADTCVKLGSFIETTLRKALAKYERDFRRNKKYSGFSFELYKDTIVMTEDFFGGAFNLIRGDMCLGESSKDMVHRSTLGAYSISFDNSENATIDYIRQ